METEKKNKMMYSVSDILNDLPRAVRNALKVRDCEADVSGCATMRNRLKMAHLLYVSTAKSHL